MRPCYKAVLRNKNRSKRGVQTPLMLNGTSLSEAPKYLHTENRSKRGVRTPPMLNVTSLSEAPKYLHADSDPQLTRLHFIHEEQGSSVRSTEPRLGLSPCSMTDMQMGAAVADDLEHHYGLHLTRLRSALPPFLVLPAPFPLLPTVWLFRTGPSTFHSMAALCPANVYKQQTQSFQQDECLPISMHADVQQPEVKKCCVYSGLGTRTFHRKHVPPGARLQTPGDREHPGLVKIKINEELLRGSVTNPQKTYEACTNHDVVPASPTAHGGYNHSSIFLPCARGPAGDNCPELDTNLPEDIWAGGDPKGKRGIQGFYQTIEPDFNQINTFLLCQEDGTEPNQTEDVLQDNEPIPEPLPLVSAAEWGTALKACGGASGRAQGEPGLEHGGAFPKIVSLLQMLVPGAEDEAGPKGKAYTKRIPASWR
ncbi:hypothetical protein Anapl_03581 [Anas platyrhynchos]|uniref:Uncharacterized protein n=1 Tax=Anas platyrhynchos TaxID=8839 RepID=R0M441_ANAPL|nr:hypothetical protein Anapl_03581 [Anas platyrhynchos]